MEETLTDCLVRVKEDLNKVRDYLNTSTETGQYSITWRTIEAFNTILGVCSSQHSPQTSALDTLLDSFYHLARNNTDPSVWNEFGFELGIICVKVLSAIERSEIFEILFCKLLIVVNVICESNTNVWKAAARQILNVFINKKFSLFYFERVLKLYICILRNIESPVLFNFSSQNLHLLKALSKLVQKVGDFEIQNDIIELVFLHLLNNKQLMSDFFAPEEKKLFESLQFSDFEADCRTYLNALNKPRGGLERKVYSVCCHVLYLGGCFVEPPVGTHSFWVDANKETERLSIRCADLESEGNRVIYILFSDIMCVQLANEKTEGNRCLTLQTRSLSGLQLDVKNEDICLIVENGEALFEFVNFLNEETRRKRKLARKVSKTRDSLLINRSNTNKIEMVQDNAVTSSEKPGIDHILPDILNLFETSTEELKKTSQSSRILSTENKTPPRSQNVIMGSQELSPNSFVESLNKHIGKNSPEIPHTFEDSVETIEFIQRNIPGGSQKLFRSPNKEVERVKNEEPNNFHFMFNGEKENNPIVKPVEPKLKTYQRKREKSKPLENPLEPRVLRGRKNVEQKLANTQSQDYFQHSACVTKKRRPTLPKLKRSVKARNQKPEACESKVENKQEKKRPSCRTEPQRAPQKNEREKKGGTKDSLEKMEARIQNQKNQDQEKQKKSEGQKMMLESSKNQQISKLKPSSSKTKFNLRGEKKLFKQQEFQMERKPSLLDPNGYAYRRWCEPTTSERSNFWLKKLGEAQKLKVHSYNVFNFSEDSDSVSAKSKRKKRRIVHSKRKFRTKDMEQISLKQVKEIIKKTSPKEKQKVNYQKIMNSKETLSKVPSQSPESIKNKSCNPQSKQSNHVVKHNSSPRSSHQDSSKELNTEPIFFNEDENPSARVKKRERSIEENSLTKTHIKKKYKTTFPSGKFLTALQWRLHRKKEEDKNQTEEIIRTVKKAVNHLFNYRQRKEGQKIMSYLSVTEEAVAAVEADVGSLSLRAKRIQRAMLYFQAGCSVSDLCKSMEEHFSGVRSALENWKEKKDFSKMIGRANERLMGLIKSEIERSIENEFAAKRNKLLKCASMIDADCVEFL